MIYNQDTSCLTHISTGPRERTKKLGFVLDSRNILPLRITTRKLTGSCVKNLKESREYTLFFEKEHVDCNKDYGVPKGVNEIASFP